MRHERGIHGITFSGMETPCERYITSLDLPINLVCSSHASKKACRQKSRTCLQTTGQRISITYKLVAQCIVQTQGTSSASDGLEAESLPKLVPIVSAPTPTDAAESCIPEMQYFSEDYA